MTKHFIHAPADVQSTTIGEGTHILRFVAVLVLAVIFDVFRQLGSTGRRHLPNWRAVMHDIREYMASAGIPDVLWREKSK